MAFVLKYAKTVRNNWKKSVVCVAAAAYGVKYAKEKYDQEWIRREFCAEALKYGNAKIGLQERPRKITVFLNPAASGGGAVKVFEKNAAPILHCAGLEVNIVKVEYEGQVKKFLSILERSDTDGIVVAGGDGTLLETITGIMRKEDKTFRQNIPVGVIPLGHKNRFAKLLFGSDNDQVLLMCQCAMSVVRGLGRSVDVISLKEDNGRTAYALCGLEMGAFREAEQRKSKYWYFGGLKHRMTYLRSAFLDWPPVLKAKLSYVLATEENTQPRQQTEQPKEQPKGSWLSMLFKPKVIKPKAELFEEETDDDNDVVETRNLSTVELTTVSTCLQDPGQTVKGLELGIGPAEPSIWEFISEGWRRVSEPTLRLGTRSNETILVKKIRIEPEDPTKFYNIDGELFESVPVTIELLRKRVKFFCVDPDFKIS
ncbi:acylglycerol kinase, mitochondrial-like isoform X2 [Mizuhopecten yessoensis]|uniref:Acylglycerol kinase, mitochondrial n=1 Tax=Mizuhopecten yessoensis TaxID=6573 RepID=A0A210PJH0_MIZYE|nr:acylglycerol kinase, mitochondrial-like isoform X2 [Mizuhopecten yessoensis]OWF36638.1 Acylglycerol kinase, mitochondrial [Mizuhopecten yessoensis]